MEEIPLQFNLICNAFFLGNLNKYVIYANFLDYLCQITPLFIMNIHVTNALCMFVCFRWIHDYQDACIDKLERFLHGEENTGRLDLDQLAQEGLGGSEGLGSHGSRKASRDSKESTGSVSHPHDA